MKRVFLLAIAVAVVGAASAASARQQQGGAQATTVVNRSGAPEDVEGIIRSFARRESEFRKALNEYSFKRDAVIQTIEPLGGQISGEYHRVSRFVFDDTGKRYEKILHFPIPTLTQITISNEDLDDLGGVQVFALEASNLHEYNIAYVGKERVDELDTYVFDVTPKVLSDQKRLKELKKSKTPQRFFQGRVWVDDRDFQIVKAKGKGVPEFDQRFPTFETYREHIDGKYWFPTYTYADDELVFKSGQVVRVRMRVKYTDFEPVKGKVRVIETDDLGDDVKGKDPSASPSPTPAAKPKP
ncbi:MAG TPA: hypothetical protein VD968_10745 [Pyrinomonadaceae bacterium]|nr:hypothetical protein [Pyrinomonadaceae bacterium]